MDTFRQLVSTEARWVEEGGGLLPLSEARRVWADLRVRFGYARKPAKLLTPPDGNTKLAKSVRRNYGLSLPPADSALVRFDPTSLMAVPLARWVGDGRVERITDDSWLGSVALNQCRYSTPECRMFCVAHAGKGALDNVQLSRASKLGLLLENMPAFVTLLVYELELVRKYVLDHGLAPAIVRLNAFTDFPWEQLSHVWSYLAEVQHGGLFQFYDYTKWPPEVRPGVDPEVYFLTRSVSEKWSDRRISDMVSAGHQCVVIASDITSKVHRVPTRLFGVRAVDGDTSDDRIADGPGTLVVLRPKGGLRSADSPFKRPVLQP